MTRLPSEKRPLAWEWGPVDSIEIKNFRGFEALTAENLARINLVVGDNGVGKTALLEAIYLLVSGHSQQPVNLKRWRGMDIGFQVGSKESLVEDVFGDLFHDLESRGPISITATGRGFENRKLEIAHEGDDIVVPLKPNRKARRTQAKVGRPEEAMSAPLSFTWTDDRGEPHVARVLMSPNNVRFEGTNEKLPSCHMFAAQIQVAPSEAARMFSELVKKRQIDRFKKVILGVFDDITDISVANHGDSAALWADVPWATRLLPLAALSGATSRAAAIMLAITARREGLVLVDEVEGGIYHERQEKFARALFDLSAECDTQLIMTTHSLEWLENVLDCVNNSEDMAFWRLERNRNNNPVIKRFSVEEFRTGLSMGDMR